MGRIEKQISLIVDGLNIKVSNPLSFYVNDKIMLAISINEVHYTFNNRSSRTKSLVRIVPEQGELSIETPLGLDFIEPFKVEDGVIYFDLGSKYTSCVGTSVLQLFIKTSEGYRKAIPPFNMTVTNTTNEELDGSPKKEVSLLLNDNGDCLLSSNNEIIIFK